ncbi:hypothetical protein [Ktedonospora formicarum]|uniref:Uncharacterized protein n=1 Tax=Ktedonospora formicarum TaxID=2778364 RepID=A0A8J3I159_9CHLR|nr:hypothetical protein [Ktedonospora formicarum]GHO48107.1 hypothetical protein KSX_62700 [Ktedonospora formicarum]
MSDYQNYMREVRSVVQDLLLRTAEEQADELMGWPFDAAEAMSQMLFEQLGEEKALELRRALTQRGFVIRP